MDRSRRGFSTAMTLPTISVGREQSGRCWACVGDNKDSRVSAPDCSPDRARRGISHAESASVDGPHCKAEVVGPDEDDRCRRPVLAVGRLTVPQTPQEVPGLVACARAQQMAETVLHEGTKVLGCPVHPPFDTPC